jgi:hypothetical protein
LLDLFSLTIENIYILKCRLQWQLTAVKLLAAAATAAVQAARRGPEAAFPRSATVGVTIAAMRVTVLRLAAVFRQLRAAAQQLTRRQCPGPGRKQCPGPIGPARRRAQCSRRSKAPFRYLHAVKRVKPRENFAVLAALLIRIQVRQFCKV